MRQAAHDRHSSRSAVARALKQPTRKAWVGPTAFPIWSCSRRGMPSMPRHRGIWWALAPPFHPYRAMRGGLLSVALSEGRPPWVLPSVLPCGARTFLTWPRGPQRRSVRLPRVDRRKLHRTGRSLRNYASFSFALLQFVQASGFSPSAASAWESPRLLPAG